MKFEEQMDKLRKAIKLLEEDKLPDKTIEFSFGKITINEAGRPIEIEFNEETFEQIKEVTSYGKGDVTFTGEIIKIYGLKILNSVEKVI